LSTFCTDGVCCSSGPCGSCNSCAAAPGGRCSPVAAGPDPAGLCADQGSMSCGTNGLCDGAGKCALHVGNSCAAPGCSGSKLLGASTCDGAGNCTPTSTTDCTPYACAAGACNTGCALPGDCATGATCTPNPDGGQGACM
jgi:hypothetical protein